jgi:hypothetical protein
LDKQRPDNWVSRKSFECLWAERKAVDIAVCPEWLKRKTRSTGSSRSDVSKPGDREISSEKMSGEGVSDKLKRTRRHPTHGRKQFFSLERLVEKFVSTDGIACFAGFDAAGGTHHQDFGVGKV